ncbi:MAG: ribosome hibernation promotion factor [Mycobacteriales bacterium]
MAATTTDVHVQTRGTVLSDEVTYAREKVAAAVRHAPSPVLHVRAKLTYLPDPALQRPALVQVNVDLQGRPVRVQVAAETVQEAVDEAYDRLRERLDRAAGDWEAIRGRRTVPSPRSWRHDSLPAARTDFYPRPAEDREVLRHKAFVLTRMTVEEAAWDMALLGYDFHLFTEEGSGEDCVLHRDDDGLRLSQVHPSPEQVTRGEVPFSVSSVPPPTLNVDGATERLDLSGWPFVFFVDARTGRGAVLYHRYDGHLGLITPAD